MGSSQHTIVVNFTSQSEIKNPMLLDLDEIERAAKDLGFEVNRESTDSLDVKLCEAATLSFMNSIESNDNAFGFRETPWHTHDDLYISKGGGSYRTLSPSDVLLGLACGELSVSARYIAGDVKDMWIDHPSGLGGEFEFYEAGEEIRAWRIA